MPKLKELWKRDLPPTHPPFSFPCLSRLQITYCHDLASLELPPSSLLSRIEITSCPQLTSLLLPPFPLLSQLGIEYCGDLAFLELHSSPLLSGLEIRQCCKLASLLLHSSSLLTHLEINFCDELTSLELRSSPLLSKLKINGWAKLTSLQVSSLPSLKTLYPHNERTEVLRQLVLVSQSSLEMLCINNMADMTSLPDELLQPVSTLQCLTIEHCCHLAALPHWICFLTSLTQLNIYYCKHLTEKCRAEIGEDWPKIAHIPHIRVEDHEAFS